MKQIKVILMIVLAVYFFMACDSDDEGKRMVLDITPIEFKIFISDSLGHSLLDSTYQSNLIKDITVSYEGETYPVMTEREYYEKMQGKSLTRVYQARFKGLIMFSSGGYDYFLSFGEFSGEEDVDKREIVLNLPNQQSVRLAYSNFFRSKSNGEPDKKTQFYFNDQELDGLDGICGRYYLRCSENGIVIE